MSSLIKKKYNYYSSSCVFLFYDTPLNCTCTERACSQKFDTINVTYYHDNVWFRKKDGITIYFNST